MATPTPRGLHRLDTIDPYRLVNDWNKAEEATDAALTAVESVLLEAVVDEETARRVGDARVTAVSALAQAWDGPIAVGGDFPTDRDTLHISPELVVSQWSVPPEAPGTAVNLTKQTATHATTGILTTYATVSMGARRVNFQWTSTSAGRPVINPGLPYCGRAAASATNTISATLGNASTSASLPLTLWAVTLNQSGTALASGQTSVTLAPGESQRISAAVSGAGAYYVQWWVSGARYDPEGVPGWVSDVRHTSDGATEPLDGDHPLYRWQGEPGLSFTVATEGGWAPVTSTADLNRPKPEVPAVTTAPGDNEDIGLTHHMRRTLMRRRKGGTIGIGNKLAVAIRLDHGAQELIDTGVAQRLQDHGLPYHLALCESPSPTVAAAEAPVPWDDVRELARTGGAEIGNHSLTHGHADTPEAAWDEVVEGRKRLQARVPEQSIEVWTQPGNRQYDWGEQDAETQWGEVGPQWKDPMGYAQTYGGRLIMAEHGFVAGVQPMVWTPLTGEPIDGSWPAWIGSGGRAFIDTWLGRALPGHGITIATHSAWIGDTGKPTLADTLDWIDYLAELRDAGRIVVLTHAGLATATSLHDHRPALIQWSGDVPAGVQKSAFFPGGRAHIDQYEHVYGTQWEAHLDVTATDAGRVTLTAQIGADLVITEHRDLQPGQRVQVRRHMLLPLPASASPILRVDATGGATCHDLRLQAV